MTIKGWMSLTSMSERRVYEELGKGNLKAIKVGSRTLLDVDLCLAWLRSCPPANIKPPLPDKRSRRTAEATAGVEA